MLTVVKRLLRRRKALRLETPIQDVFSINERALLLACLQDKIELTNAAASPRSRLAPEQRVKALCQREDLERLKARLLGDAT